MEAINNPATNKKREEKKRFRWNMRRITIAASTAAVMLFCAIFIPIAVMNNSGNPPIDKGFESGFAISDSKPARDFPYFPTSFAYRFSKSEYDINDVSAEIFYGHGRFHLEAGATYYDEEEEKYYPFTFQNAVSNTQLFMAPTFRIQDRLLIKQVDNFLTESYHTTSTWIDREANLARVEYAHSETIKISKEWFVGECGSFA